MMKNQATIVFTFWDVLQYKVWDKICVVKGLGEDFTFESVYDKDYEFELTTDEVKKLGLKLKR